MKYDFCGWATKHNTRCADGLVIKQNAFESCDGEQVPLVWGHRHDKVSNILGHALLENRDEGVYAYCSLNSTQSGKDAKEVISHGDVVSLSIFANNVERYGNNVIHGVIREVSLVLAGANPGAFIESAVAHGQSMDVDEEECICYSGSDIIVEAGDSEIRHSDTPKPKKEEEKPKPKPAQEEGEDDDEKEESVRDVINTLTDKQKAAVGILIEQAAGDGGKNQNDDEEDEDEKDKKKKEGSKEMAHSLFEGTGTENNETLSHDMFKQLIKDAKKSGSLRDTIQHYIDDGIIVHAGTPTDGMTTATGTQAYGFRDPEMLFPDYQSVNGNMPIFIQRNMGWVDHLMSKIHNVPFSRIKSVYADITEDDARARGYIKGKMKKEEFFTLLKRTTDPQTIYKKQKLDRDDIVDITDLDIVMWIKSEMRLMLNEEIARAILLGDGRPSDSDDKIKEDHIRPIAKDVGLFTIKHEVAGATPAEIAENFIDESVRARKDYKGSGQPDLYTTESMLTEMLLLKDKDGHRIYKTEEELKTTLRVASIQPVELMEGEKVDNKQMLGIIVNAGDYRVGANKGGAITSFEDFDIDFNQEKYLMETRISGALVQPFSAIVITSATASTASYSERTSSSK